MNSNLFSFLLCDSLPESIALPYFVSSKLPSYISFLLLFLVVTEGESLRAQLPVSSAMLQTMSVSPDGKFLVRRSQAEPGGHGEARKSLEICSANGTVLYAWASGLGVTTILWSPDSRYLAVNDMPGEQGDLVRLFALDPALPAVTAIRLPNGKKLLKEEEERHGSFLSTIDAVSLRAVDWRDGRIWCLLSGNTHPKREPMVHVPFHHLLVFSVQGTKAPALVEEWTRTDPKEYPVRDQ